MWRPPAQLVIVSYTLYIYCYTSCYKVNVEWNAIGIGIDSYSGLLDRCDVWNVLNPIHLSHLRILDKLNKEKHSEQVSMRSQQCLVLTGMWCERREEAYAGGRCRR